MIPGAQGDGGDYAIAQVTGHVPRNHMEAAPVFDEITGDPLNDPARVLVGQEPKGYNEVDSLDEAIALADSRSRTIPTPRSYDEWAELLELLTVDNEKPARPQAVDALHRALDAMESKPVAFVDAIGQWIARRLAGGGDEPSSHVTLKVLKVIISLLDGVVQDEDEAGVQTGVARYCVSMPSIFSSAESASDLTGSLTGSAGRAGGSGNSVGEAFAVAIRAHCTELLQELAELDVAPDPQWGERPMQMIRAAARGAMIRAHGQRKDFGVEYSADKRARVRAGELVAWEFRERSAGGPHTLDFKLEFIGSNAEPEEAVEILPVERLAKHAGSIVAEDEGELVFSFNNEFSWVNNKAITLTLGQWPSRQGAPPVMYGSGAARGSEPEPEPGSRGGGGRSAAGLLRSLRSGGGAQSAPPAFRGEGAAAVTAPRVANDGESDDEDESAPLAI